MDNFEKIDQYLDKELPENELVLFEEELMTDPKLEAELRFHKEINESIIDDEVYELRNKLGVMISESKVKSLFPAKVAVSIAASVLVVVLSFWLFNKVNTDSLYSNYYAVYTPDTNERSVTDHILTNELEIGIRLFKNKEFKEALDIFENYTEQAPGNNTALFYKGLCYMELEDYEGAEDCLLALTASNDYALALHSKWYLSLLYIKTNRLEEASDLLEQLSAKRNYYSAKAQELLKKI